MMDRPADVVVVLKVPPGTNALWRPIWRDGKPDMRRTAPYEKWRKEAADTAAYCRHGDRLTGAFAARLTVPKNGYDLDAPLKAVLDALQAGCVIPNDKFAEEIVLLRDLSREPGKILVELWAMPQTQNAALVRGGVRGDA